MGPAAGESDRDLAWETLCIRGRPAHFDSAADLRSTETCVPRATASLMPSFSPSLSGPSKLRNCREKKNRGRVRAGTAGHAIVSGHRGPRTAEGTARRGLGEHVRVLVTAEGHTTQAVALCPKDTGFPASRPLWAPRCHLLSAVTLALHATPASIPSGKTIYPPKVVTESELI